MKGIILAGGAGSRLAPLTRITSKQLLPVYDKPMIFYPLGTLLAAGIRDILIIVAPDHAGDFLNILGSGKEYGARFSYEIQERPQGLPEAFVLGERFIGNDSVALILGDNIFEDDFSRAVSSFRSGAAIFAKAVPDPQRFGVVVLDKHGKPKKIVEKPKRRVSDFAIVGLYLYDHRVVTLAKKLKPSRRGETEIVDLHNAYLKINELSVHTIHGEWIDAGTFDSLLKANLFAAGRKKSEEIMGR